MVAQNRLPSPKERPIARGMAVGSRSHFIARAIEWLIENCASPLRIEELAARVHMSPSRLHHHFRRLTAMSPLQHQKWLRLNEARRLMLNDGFNVANAAFRVGSESPSQFSREYNRTIGAPPLRDVAKLRESTAGARARAARGVDRLDKPGMKQSATCAPRRLLHGAGHAVRVMGARRRVPTPDEIP